MYYYLLYYYVILLYLSIYTKNKHKNHVINKKDCAAHQGNTIFLKFAILVY